MNRCMYPLHLYKTHPEQIMYNVVQERFLKLCLQDSRNEVQQGA